MGSNPFLKRILTWPFRFPFFPHGIHTYFGWNGKVLLGSPCIFWLFSGVAKSEKLSVLISVSTIISQLSAKLRYIFFFSVSNVHLLKKNRIFTLSSFWYYFFPPEFFAISYIYNSSEICEYLAPITRYWRVSKKRERIRVIL